MFDRTNPQFRRSDAGSPMPTHIVPRLKRQGRQRYFSGHAAEDQVERHYVQKGGAVLSRNCRTPEGEIDLVASVDGVLVFVEVKQRKNNRFPDQPISPRQWRRLENAAIHYMMQTQMETGVQPICRFDVALTGHDGQVRIIENARSFDEH